MGNRVTFKELLETHGFSQNGLSRLSGVSLTTISALARGERDFRVIQVKNASKIAQAFGMTIEDIILTLKED